MGIGDSDPSANKFHHPKRSSERSIQMIERVGIVDLPRFPRHLTQPILPIPKHPPGGIFRGDPPAKTHLARPVQIFLYEAVGGNQKEVWGKERNGRIGIPQYRCGKMPELVNIMGELRKLLGENNRSICNGMSGDPSIRLAYHHLMNGDLRGSEVRFQRILKDNPQDAEALAGMAICVAQNSGRFISATKLASEAVRLAPKSPAGYYALGTIHLMGSKLEQGYRYLMKAKHLAPQDPRLETGFALFDQGRPPVISDLSRTHPLNRALGKVRAVMEFPMRQVQRLSLKWNFQEPKMRVTSFR